MENATIRDCLNAIAKAAGDNYYWILSGIKAETVEGGTCQILFFGKVDDLTE